MTIVDYEKAFDRVDYSLLWKKLGQYDFDGEVFSVIEKLYGKTEAYLDVNRSRTDVFESRVGVRQGDNLPPLLFIIITNDVSSKFTDMRLNFEEMNKQVF